MIEVRLTNTYTSSQKIAMIVLTVSLYLCARNCGMVYILFFKYIGIIKIATMTRVPAAIHSYVEIARPMAKPEPLMPIKCSAEILEAINEAPIAHHVNEPSARKKSLELVCLALFIL